jgi:uncharacterized protein (UPF0371 family)
MTESKFWVLYCQLVGLVYATVPAERVNIVVPFLEERYGPTNSNVYRKIESHVLRTVAWMELFE